MKEWGQGCVPCAEGESPSFDRVELLNGWRKERRDELWSLKVVYGQETIEPANVDLARSVLLRSRRWDEMSSAAVVVWPCSLLSCE